MDDAVGDEPDGKNEMIVPLDHQYKGYIADDVINRRLIGPLPPGVRLHALVDSCHSGTSMDLRHSVECCRKTGEFRWKDQGENACAARPCCVLPAVAAGLLLSCPVIVCCFRPAALSAPVWLPRFVIAALVPASYRTAVPT